MRKFVLALLILFTVSVPQLSAEIIALQSDRLEFEYRVDDPAGVGSGNVDFSYRGVDFGVNEAWFLSTGGSTTEITGGTVTDGAMTAGDEKVWTVNQGDLAFRVNFFANDEFQAGTDKGISVEMKTVLFNNSSTETAAGSLYNYSQMQIANGDGGSLVASTAQDRTEVYTFQEDAIGLAAYTAKRWNAAFAFDGSATGLSASGWAIEPLSSNLLDSIRSGSLLNNADGGTLFESNITGAAQWEFELAPQTGVQIQSDLTVFIRSVPEPGSIVTLYLLGLVIIRRVRNK